MQGEPFHRPGSAENIQSLGPSAVNDKSDFQKIVNREAGFNIQVSFFYAIVQSVDILIFKCKKNL